MDEEARAAEYRAQRQRRIQWERDNAIRLRGDVDAAAAVRTAWQPVIDASYERYVFEPLDLEYHDRDRWSAA